MDLLTFSLGLSLHLGFEGDYNNIHPHARYRQDDFIAGAYYNSERSLSTYIGYIFEKDKLGLEIAAVTGYDAYSVVPMVRVTYENFYVTPVPIGSDTGVVIGYELKF